MTVSNLFYPHVKCSLCEQTFNLDDPDLFFRKSRHEDYHSPCKNAHRTNRVLDKVEWIEVKCQVEE